ncbi:cytochrome P450 [Metarhizium robertsii]|uniref:Cytochrome P450 CYP5292B1 n=2 Tax=Metarhizium robertsii TaxID=568076 RepID=E9ESR0_METRA|nr:Cytochrome P450 CYP5292B1 [Metarhizium robertsii ARSEF 23]EFZ01933.1 Cytochrome P450 CYP5292B1 [Metarhizium robertsii ARSEF 23]EXV02435.1 cytochrome P450 [Metarhizium robertsii]
MDFFVPRFSAIALLPALVLVYWIPLTIYRIWFHPLSRFPGPKLAASTSLYSHYFNFVQGGNFIRHLEYLHDEYGPIVRTEPNELHIRDIKAYSTVFKVGSRFEKDARFYGFPFDGSHFTMATLKQARPRRDLLQPRLSKGAIDNAQHVMEKSVWRFIDLLDRHRSHDEIIDLSLAYRCVTSDVLLGYAFHSPFEALDYPRFNYPPAVHMDAALMTSFFAKNFPLLFTLAWNLASCLPRSLLKYLGISFIFDIQDVRHFRFAFALRKLDDQLLYPTMLDMLMDPDQEKFGPPLPMSDLVSEAAVLLSAGNTAPSLTLTLGTFYALHNRHVLETLQDELSHAIPDKRKLPPLDTLRRLPYLTGIIKESLRFSLGAPGKLPRITPDEGAFLCGRQIPPKTSISLSHWVYHFDPTIFPDPKTFRPERWVNDRNGELDRYMLSFSRGSRSCIGINLAYAELYLLFAAFFTNFRPVLRGTREEDMEVRDYFAPVCNGRLKVSLGV